MSCPRRRLAPGDRRNQLLDVGARFFAARRYEDVLMEQIAAEAGVSRALVYRYFPSKRDLFAAIYQRAADELLAATGCAAGTPLADWVAAGLDAHIDYFVANENTVLAANRDLAGDPVIQGIISTELSTLRDRLVEAVPVDGHRRAMISLALLAWLSFVRTACVEWLAHKTLTRDELRDLCLRALAGVVE